MKILFDRVEKVNLTIKIGDFIVMCYYGILHILSWYIMVYSLIKIYSKKTEDKQIYLFYIIMFILFIRNKYWLIFKYYKLKYNQKYKMSVDEKKLLIKRFEKPLNYNMNEEFGINEELSFTLEGNYNLSIHGNSNKYSVDSIILKKKELSKKTKKNYLLYYKRKIIELITKIISFLDYPWSKICLFLFYDNKNKYYNGKNVLIILILVLVMYLKGVLIYVVFRFFILFINKFKFKNLIYKDKEDYFEKCIFALIQSLILIRPIGIIGFSSMKINPDPDLILVFFFYIVFQIIFSIKSVYNSLQVRNATNQGDYFEAEKNSKKARFYSKWIIFINNFLIIYVIIIKYFLLDFFLVKLHLQEKILKFFLYFFN